MECVFVRAGAVPPRTCCSLAAEGARNARNLCAVRCARRQIPVVERGVCEKDTRERERERDKRRAEGVGGSGRSVGFIMCTAETLRCVFFFFFHVAEHCCYTWRRPWVLLGE